MTDTPPRDVPTPPEPVGRPGSRRVLWLAVAAGAGLLGLVAWLVVARLVPYLTTPDAGATPDARAAAAPEARRISATLFYVSEDGGLLDPVAREVPYGATRELQARLLVEAQVQAPAAGRVSAIPPGTTVRNVFLSDTGQAFVDLGGTIVSGHSGGSLDEALAVYAIVNVVTTNLPDVTGVQILVEGKEVDSLRGHLDLRYPLAKSVEWIRKGQ